MNSFKIVTLLAVVAASVLAAPTDIDTSSATTATSFLSSEAPVNPSSEVPHNETSSIPSGSTTVMSPSASSFTCFNRTIGYYGDVERECKIYHFCLLGDYNGEIVYQRISYLCLNETVFDQQALDCVDSKSVNAPCVDSPKFYEESNRLLRDAVVGKEMHENVEPTMKPTEAS